MWRRGMVVVWLMLIAVLATAQKVDPAERVRTAYQAESRARLAGEMRTTSYLPTGELSTEVVVYRKAGMARYEYRSPLLRGLVLIDRGGTLIRLDPTTRTGTVETAHRGPATVDLLLKNYQATLAGVENLLGRQTDVILLKRRQAEGPSRKLWIDRKTGTILRIEQYNSSGKLVSRSFYTSVNWNADPDDSLFTVPAGWRRVVAAQQPERHRDKLQLSRELGFTVREPSYVPPGFVLDGFHLVYRPNRLPSVHIRYVDGLNSISIFEHQCSHGKGWGFQWGRRVGRRGSCELFTSAEGNVLVKEMGNIRFIVVGDLPEAELQKVVDSLRF